MPVTIQRRDIPEIRDAILAAFPKYSRLKTGVQSVLKSIAPATEESAESTHLPLPNKGIYAQRVWDLVENWESFGRTADLIGGLARIVPNPQLRTVERRLLQMISIPVGITELQGFVYDCLGHEPALCWLDKLRARMNCVCRIDALGFNPPGLGTGFLIRRDLVLSAYHVVEHVESRPLLAETVHCRFDCFDEKAATTTKGGRLVKLMWPGWFRAKSVPGPLEKYPGGAEPTAAELDFVLLRLAEPAGDDTIGASGKRDVIPLATTLPAEGHPLLVLQHPNRAALRLSFGSITGSNQAGTRLRHSAATEQGASGAPCLNQQLELMGLHNAARYPSHGALASYNTAVPIALIIADLAGKGERLGA